MYHSISICNMLRAICLENWLVMTCLEDSLEICWHYSFPYIIKDYFRIMFQASDMFESWACPKTGINLIRNHRKVKYFSFYTEISAKNFVLAFLRQTV